MHRNTTRQSGRRIIAIAMLTSPLPILNNMFLGTRTCKAGAQSGVTTHSSNLVGVEKARRKK